MICFICGSSEGVRFDLNLSENVCGGCLEDMCSGERDTNVIGCPNLCLNQDKLCKDCVDGSLFYEGFVSKSTGDMG